MRPGSLVIASSHGRRLGSDYAHYWLLKGLSDAQAPFVTGRRVQ